MRKTVVVSLLSVIIFSVCSCSNKKSGATNQDMVTIDIPLQADESTQLPRVSELFQVTDVVLSTSSIESLVGSIYDIKHCGDTLFILSGDALLLFKTDGRFITKIDHQGRGHGEYVDLVGFEIDQKNNNILIFDRFGVLRYTMDGKFIDKAPIKGMPIEFALLPSGDYVFYGPMLIDDLQGLWLTDSKGNYKRHLLTLCTSDRTHWRKHTQDEGGQGKKIKIGIKMTPPAKTLWGQNKKVFGGQLNFVSRGRTRANFPNAIFSCQTSFMQLMLLFFAVINHKNESFIQRFRAVPCLKVCQSNSRLLIL
ncbi:MAG: 6-bladed beta-propeller [Bacteroidaceae bacterium]|nr:6-bladed beta-propeller [Bacteroidaceae bacterium]